jgi:hypothetical protein
MKRSKTMPPIKEIDIALGIVVIMQGPSAGTIGIIGG